MWNDRLRLCAAFGLLVPAQLRPELDELAQQDVLTHVDNPVSR
jgi:hypothetical protein